MPDREQVLGGPGGSAPFTVEVNRSYDPVQQSWDHQIFIKLYTTALETGETVRHPSVRRGRCTDENIARFEIKPLATIHGEFATHGSETSDVTSQSLAYPASRASTD